MNTQGYWIPFERSHTCGELRESNAGETVRLMGWVQRVRDLGKGRTRYGLHCVSDQRAQGTLAEGLQRASMRIQREQLRRLAGRA